MATIRKDDVHETNYIIQSTVIVNHYNKGVINMTKRDFNVDIFINNVEYFCKKYNIKIGTLEQRCGVSSGYFSRICSKDGQKIPKMNVALAVATNLKVPLEILAQADFSNAISETEQLLLEYITELMNNTNRKNIHWKKIPVENITSDEELKNAFRDEKFASPFQYNAIGATVIPWSSQTLENKTPLIETLYSTTLGERILYFVGGVCLPYNLLAINYLAQNSDHFYGIWLYTEGQLYRMTYAQPDSSALIFGALQSLDTAATYTNDSCETKNMAPAVEQAIEDLLKKSALHQGV